MGPARNLFTPENYNGASAARKFVPLLAATKNKYGSMYRVSMEITPLPEKASKLRDFNSEHAIFFNVTVTNA